jgi:hypothetical protein
MQLKSNINSMPLNLDSLAKLGAKEQENALAQNTSSDEFAKLLGSVDMGEEQLVSSQKSLLNNEVEVLENSEQNLVRPSLDNLEGLNQQLQSDVDSASIPVNKISTETQATLLNHPNSDISSSLNNSKNESAENLKASDLNTPDLKTIVEKTVELPKNRNAEDASRQFMPGRKSIFDVAKNSDNKVQVTNQEASNKLLDLENFMSRQSPTVQKRIAHKTYQNEVKSSLLNKKLAEKIDSIARPIPKNNIMQMMLEQDVKAMDRHIQVQAPTNQSSDLGSQLATQAPKVFDLSSLRGSESRDAVIDQIQNYIVQAKAASEPKVEMSFKHHELGVIDLQVQKTTGDQISISIGSNSTEGMKFFTQNQSELLGSLTSAGIKVAELKLDSTNSQSDFTQDSGQRQRQEFAGDQRQQDSKRREELWSLFKERREAA